MISVCMISFNGAQYIEEQLKSILPQLDELDEIIIFDDCSNDNTCQIINNIKDPRINLFQQKKQVGPSKNMESALHKAKGDYIFLSDQDDIWHPNKITISLHFLQKNYLICHDANIFYDSSTYIKKTSLSTLFQKRNAKPGIFKNLIRNSYTGCCMAFKKEILLLCLPFPQKIAMYDQWIGLTTNCFYKVYFINKALIQYRRHNANVTHLNNKKKIFYKILQQRLQIGFSLLKRYIQHMNN